MRLQHVLQLVMFSGVLLLRVLCAGGELSPADTNLLVQQGGSLVFKGTDVIFRHNDSGILKYTDVDAMMAAIDASRGSSMQPAQLTSSSSASS
jgi:pyridoxal biosynthesis lyase PdxS